MTLKPIGQDKNHWLFPLYVIAAVIFYLCLGHLLVRLIYQSGFIELLNDRLGYQHKNIEHYYVLADKLFFVLLTFVSLIVTFYTIVYSNVKVPFIWVAIICTTVLVMIYTLNQNNRVYSYHGFYRVGIVYQILNGIVPPLDPLFAGEPLLTPWGFPWLVAQISQIFNITPFYAIAGINIVSLVLVMCIIFGISRTLRNDSAGNSLSVVIAIFGTTIFCQTFLVALYRKLDHLLIDVMGLPFERFFVEIKALPFAKFSNINGAPLGFVCYFLFVYSIIQIYENRNLPYNLVLVFTSVLCCGFLYPPMLPGLVAGAGSVLLVVALLRKRSLFHNWLRKILLIASAMILALLLLIPFWLNVSSGIRGQVTLFNLEFILQNLVSYLIIVGPLLTVLFLTRKNLVAHLTPQPLIILCTFMAATSCCYLFIHIPGYVEYKFLLLASSTIGILGGFAFCFLKQRCPKIVILIVFILFMIPLVDELNIKMDFLKDFPVTYTEKGKYLYTTNEEEKQLYQWIKENTASNATFIDTTLDIPVYAQRQLFVGMNQKDERQLHGYRMNIKTLLNARHGHDLALIKKRQRIVEKIYQSHSLTDDPEVREFLTTHHSVYIVVRDRTVSERFTTIDFKQVFRSAAGNFQIYRPIRSSPPLIKTDS